MDSRNQYRNQYFFLSWTFHLCLFPLILPPCSFRPLGIPFSPQSATAKPILTTSLTNHHPALGFYTQQQRKSVLNDDRWLFPGGSTLYKDFIFFTTSPSSPFPFPTQHLNKPFLRSFLYFTFYFPPSSLPPHQQSVDWCSQTILHQLLRPFSFLLLSSKGRP